MAIMNEGHRAPTEVLENGTERFQPLYAQHHLIGGNLQPVAVDGEGLHAHADTEPPVVAWACQVIPVRHRHAQSSCHLQGDAPALGSCDIDEVVCRSGVEQSPKMGAIDYHQ
jgi:hypothetical protein